MKIIICVSNDIIYDQRMNRIAHSLSKLGHDVTIVGRRLKNTPAPTSLPYQTTFLKCLVNNGPLFYLEFNLRLFAFLFSKKIDLVYACDPDSLPAAASIKILKSIKGVYDSHEIFEETPEIANRSFVKWIWKKIELVFGKRMDQFITVNEALVEILHKKLNRDFTAIRNLPFLNKQSSEPHSEKILLYQGVLNEGRGLECSILALNHLPDYKLLLAGDGDITPKLVEMVKENKLEDQVEFLGKLTPIDLKQVTSKAKYGLNLLDASSLNYYLSLANKFFDYMAHGVPSVNMNFPLYDKYCKKYQCGITIEKLEPMKLAKAIRQLDANHHYNELRQRCLTAHQELNWEIEEQKLKVVFEKIELS